MKNEEITCADEAWRNGVRQTQTHPVLGGFASDCSGNEQAKYSAAWIRELGFEIDHAFCSTSERASDTRKLVTSLPYERKKGLKEWNFGKLDGEPEYLNPPQDQYDAIFGAMAAKEGRNLSTA